jgi:hypothetical protein
MNPSLRMGDSPVMLSAAKYLSADRDRPFAALRVTIGGTSKRDSPVMLSAAKHLAAQHDRPFAALRVTIRGTSRHAQVDLSPDGRMLVQYVKQAGDFSDRAFTMPSLTITGSAANS